MQKMPRRVLWLVLLCVVVLAGAGVLTSLTLRAVSPEVLPDHVLSIVWLNVGLQLALLAVAVYVGSRLFRRDRLRSASEARTRNLADLALLSGGLAHEMRNHLHALQSRIGLLRKASRDDQAVARRVEKLDEIVQAMEEILNDFLTYARPASDELEDVEAAELVRSVTDFEALDLERANIRIDVDVEPGIRLLVDRRKFQRALLNLVVNARQAMPGGGTLRITCRQTRFTIQLVVQDTGGGIPPEDLPQVFDSYFTTKSDGTGLGLAIVRRTIEDLGGQVRCRSQVGRGTSFTIELPKARPADVSRSHLKRHFSEPLQGDT